MSTRFYFDAAVNFSNNFTADAGWEVANFGVLDGSLVYKNEITSLVALGNSSGTTVPITTTQDIRWKSFASQPLPVGGPIEGTFSLVIRCSESAATANVSLAVVVVLMNYDANGNQTIKGTLYSNFNADTEFAAAGSDATRIISAGAITRQVAVSGDRLMVQLGVHAAAPTAATSFLVRTGFSAATDFALTTALTTDLNPWCEFSQNLFPGLDNNHQFVKAGDGMSVTEKIR